MDQKYTYAFRGIIGFVAFTNLGVAVKAIVEKKCLLIEISQSDSVNLVLPRVFGSLAILQAIILIHCALCIYQKPLISLGIFSSLLNLSLYMTETFIFRTVSFDFQIILPCTLNVIMITGFIASLLEFKVKKEYDDENAELLKFAHSLRKTRGMKKFKQ